MATDPVCANPACKVPFKPKRPWQKYHTKRCLQSHWHNTHPRVALGKTYPEIVQAQPQAVLPAVQESVAGNNGNGNGKRTFHHRYVDRTAILQKTVEILRKTQPTTAQIGEFTGSDRVSSDISEVRACGYNISAVYIGFVNGKKIYRYVLKENL